MRMCEGEVFVFEWMRAIITNVIGGIYNVGGGKSGIVQALKKDNHTDEIVCIGHNLTHQSAEYLLDGCMAVWLYGYSAAPEFIAGG